MNLRRRARVAPVIDQAARAIERDRARPGATGRK
jgi:hypothetical protein